MGAVFAVAAFTPYIADIFRRRTEPHMYSWLVWSIIQITAVTLMVLNGSGIGALGLGIGAVLCVFVFILSFWYGTKNITRFDEVSLAGALSAIIVWWATSSAFFAAIIVIIIDLVGFLPTMRKAYGEPFSETLSMWVLSGLSNLFVLFAINQYTFVTMGYVVSLVLTNFACVTVILLGRKKLALPTSATSGQS